jgi:hypothetical protein
MKSNIAKYLCIQFTRLEIGMLKSKFWAPIRLSLYISCLRRRFLSIKMSIKSTILQSICIQFTRLEIGMLEIKFGPPIIKSIYILMPSVEKVSIN